MKPAKLSKRLWCSCSEYIFEFFSRNILWGIIDINLDNDGEYCKQISTWKHIYLTSVTYVSTPPDSVRPLRYMFGHQMAALSRDPGRSSDLLSESVDADSFLSSWQQNNEYIKQAINKQYKEVKLQLIIALFPLFLAAYLSSERIQNDTKTSSNFIEISYY